MPDPLEKYRSVSYRSLESRRVLITGGASGIGAEIVAAFRAQRSQVDFIDVDREAGEAWAAASGGRFTYCDLTDIAALRAAVAKLQKAGPFNILVNNAGKDDRHAMADIEPDSWRRTLALNLDHQFFVTQAVAPVMAEAGGGSVIMLGSVSWMRGRPGMVGYTTSKAAINGLAKTLSRELGPSGIRVNSIVPGAILTERQRKLWLTQELNQQFLDLQALKFRLEGSHVARIALFLGSDESIGCTGANFMVDAGLTQN